MLKNSENIGQFYEKVGKLFMKFGIKSITMDDISKELGMSKKTLYQIVNDKAELIEKVLMKSFNDYKTNLLEVVNGSFDAIYKMIKLNFIVLENLRVFNPGVEYDLQKYYSGFYSRIKTNHIELIRKCFADNIEEGKSTGLYRDNIDTEIAAKMHLARIDYAVHSNIFSIEEFTSPGFSREVCLTHLMGIVSQKGQLLIEKHMNEFYDKKN